MNRARAIASLLALGLGVSGAAAAPPPGDDRHEQGRAIYNYRCYFCHGYSGDARTLTSTYVDPAPRDFTQTEPQTLPRRAMIETVTRGKAGTAMHGFSRVLTQREIGAVVDFVRREFMFEQHENTRYHTPENGWPDHGRYRHAFPFASGKIPLDTPWRRLTRSQARGKRLFLTSCITCHDRAVVASEGEVWRKQSISYPRNNYSHTDVDAISSASVYARHDTPPRVDGLSAPAGEGKLLWQHNCAFCHAADGTGENWIGSFLEPRPRNLTDPAFMAPMTRQRLTRAIRDGLPNTSMPAWKSVLSDTEIDQIVSYIAAAFHPLAGN